MPTQNKWLSHHFWLSIALSIYAIEACGFLYIRWKLFNEATSMPNYNDLEQYRHLLPSILIGLSWIGLFLYAVFSRGKHNRKTIGIVLLTFIATQLLALILGGYQLVFFPISDVGMSVLGSMSLIFFDGAIRVFFIEPVATLILGLLLLIGIYAHRAPYILQWIALLICLFFLMFSIGYTIFTIRMTADVPLLWEGPPSSSQNNPYGLPDAY